MRKRNILILNGTILTITALIMKCISLIFNIYISNKIGSEAIGIFSLVMSVYLFFITVATSGLSIAVTCIVSEKLATNKINSALKTIRTCILFSLILGLISAILIILFSNFIVTNCLNNIVSIRPLFYIAIGLPFIAMSSCITAYFTSIRKAYKNAIIQFIEFAVKFLCTIILLKINLNNGVEAICISLILADVISEVVSFLLNFILYFFSIKHNYTYYTKTFGEKRKIIKIAFPVAITSYIRSGLTTLKQLIIPTQLQKAGLSNALALSEYGLISGMVMPVLIFPTVFLSSYSLLLIPEFSRFLAQKNFSAINFITNKIFRLTSAFSICISTIFFIFSNELGIAIYNNLECGYYFKILSILVFFIYMDNVIDSILKGLNMQFGVMCCNIFDLTITICFIYFLLPFLGVNGFIISICLSELLNFSVSLFQLVKSIKLKIKWIDFLFEPLFCSFLSFLFLYFFHFSVTNLIFNLILNITLYVLLYCFSLFVIRKCH